MVTRNDNYGGDSLMRFARSLQQWLHFPWSISVEVTVVEWNIPEKGMRNIYQEEVIKKVRELLFDAMTILC